MAESSTCFSKAQRLLVKNAFRVVIITGRVTFEQFCRAHAADIVAGPALLTEQPRRSPLPTAQERQDIQDGALKGIVFGAPAANLRFNRVLLGILRLYDAGAAL